MGGVPRVNPPPPRHIFDDLHKFECHDNETFRDTRRDLKKSSDTLLRLYGTLQPENFQTANNLYRENWSKLSEISRFQGISRHSTYDLKGPYFAKKNWRVSKINYINFHKSAVN